MVDNETVQKSKEMAVGKMEVRTPRMRRAQLSRFDVEVISTPKTLPFRGETGDVYDQKVNIIHLTPRIPHVTEELKKVVSKATDTVMRQLFRIAPDHQDYCLEWIGTLVEGRPGLNSFCIQVIGAHFEPDIERRLMKAAVTINELVDRNYPRLF